MGNVKVSVSAHIDHAGGTGAEYPYATIQNETLCEWALVQVNKSQIAIFILDDCAPGQRGDIIETALKSAGFHNYLIILAAEGTGQSDGYVRGEAGWTRLILSLLVLLEYRSVLVRQAEKALQEVSAEGDEGRAPGAVLKVKYGAGIADVPLQKLFDFTTAAHIVPAHINAAFKTGPTVRTAIGAGQDSATLSKNGVREVLQKIASTAGSSLEIPELLAPR
jgi:hypothetical protein